MILDNKNSGGYDLKYRLSLLKLAEFATERMTILLVNANSAGTVL